MKYSAQYLVFPASFHVISRKIDYRWDSVRVRLAEIQPRIGQSADQSEPSIHPTIWGCKWQQVYAHGQVVLKQQVGLVRQPDCQAVGQSDSRTVRQSDSQTVKQSDSQTVRMSECQTVRQAVGQKGGRQARRKEGRQAGRQAGRPAGKKAVACRS